MTTTLMDAPLTFIEQVIAESVIADPPSPAVAPDTDLDPRVAAGVELLDKYLPLWALQIDLGKFELSNGACCVLGQLYGGYERGKDSLRPHVTGRDPWDEFGFVTYGAHDYTHLEDHWRKVIRERQTAAWE